MSAKFYTRWLLRAFIASTSKLLQRNFDWNSVAVCEPEIVNGFAVSGKIILNCSQMKVKGIVLNVYFLCQIFAKPFSSKTFVWFHVTSDVFTLEFFPHIIWVASCQKLGLLLK